MQEFEVVSVDDDQDATHSTYERTDIAACERRAAIVVVRPVRPLTPARCGAWVRRTVAANMPVIVEGFLKQAAKGGCAHLKMASETVATGQARMKREKGPAELMMEEMEREFGKTEPAAGRASRSEEAGPPMREG